MTSLKNIYHFCSLMCSKCILIAKTRIHNTNYEIIYLKIVSFENNAIFINITLKINIYENVLAAIYK